jgi:hypothetical protein
VLLDDHDPGDEDVGAFRQRVFLPITRPENSGQHAKPSYAVPITTGKVAVAKVTRPAWHVRREEPKFGDEFYVEPGIASNARPGRVRVIAARVDNCDDAPVPYYQITVRYLDDPYPDAILAGPAIEYHLRRLPWPR